MITDMYQLFYTWVSGIFGEDMSLKIWQYIYGSDVITTRDDLVAYFSEMLTYFACAVIVSFVFYVFVNIFRLLFGVFKWR